MIDAGVGSSSALATGQHGRTSLLPTRRTSLAQAGSGRRRLRRLDRSLPRSRHRHQEACAAKRRHGDQQVALVRPVVRPRLGARRGSLARQLRAHAFPSRRGALVLGVLGRCRLDVPRVVREPPAAAHAHTNRVRYGRSCPRSRDRARPRLLELEGRGRARGRDPRRPLHPIGGAAIRSEGKTAIAALEAREWPFDQGWEEWRPDPAWSLPRLERSWESWPRGAAD